MSGATTHAHLSEPPPAEPIEFLVRPSERRSEDEDDDHIVESTPRPVTLRERYQQEGLDAPMAARKNPGQGPPTPTRTRIHFEDFAAQIRLHRHHDHQARLLRIRQEALRKAIALSRRLYRVGRVINEDLLEMSTREDKAGFARIHRQMKDLAETCYSSWRREIQLDHSMSASVHSTSPEGGPSTSFVSKLSADSRHELFGLLHSLRSDPHFLVERIKTLSPAQVAGLCTYPRYLGSGNSAPSSLPQSRSQMSQHRRNKVFADSVEEYAQALERSNPLSFMLLNLFADGPSSTSDEQNLRIDTWSSICATLFCQSEDYHTLINQVLNSFAATQEWRAKERLEILLMNVLQRGAFLVDLVRNAVSTSGMEVKVSDPLATPDAAAFFEDAVREILAILDDPEGGLPYGALQFGSAVLAKIESAEDKSRFRGHLFIQWYIREFLTTIGFPEYENMLLQCHISKSVRDTLLHQLWTRLHESITGCFNPSPEEGTDLAVKHRVDSMIAKLIETSTATTHLAAQRGPLDAGEPASPAASSSPFIVLCTTDVLNVLDALYPRLISTPTIWDPFLSSTTSTFKSQYALGHSNVHVKFDKLRREIALFADASYSGRPPHPYQEKWTVCVIGPDSRLHLQHSLMNQEITSSQILGDFLEGQDLVRKASVKLVDRHPRLSDTPVPRSAEGVPVGNRDSLVSLFLDELEHARDRADKVDALYWHKAYQSLEKDYPLSDLIQDDTPVLSPILHVSSEAHQRTEKSMLDCEQNLISLQDSFDQLRVKVEGLLTQLDRLRTKMWYAMDVTSSKVYEDARNVASALNNMTVVSSNNGQSSDVILDSEPRSASRAITGRLFAQSHRDTMNILKAPAEHGGPKKLAEAQLEMVKAWIQHNGIDVFCKGEERIHRFCMEIRTAAKKLVGESLSESPVLWSSELYAPERMSLDNALAALAGSYSGTRPPSVKSETSTSYYHTSRASGRGMDHPPRVSIYDSRTSPVRKSSFHSLGSSRVARDALGTDVSPFSGSPDRTSSTTNSDSISGLFSPLHAQSQSATSMSIGSRAASTYNDVENAKFVDQSAKEKSKFLESVQSDLICLMLSDLGCPVWSCGSETDAWLESVSADERVRRRLQQRSCSARLLADARSGRTTKHVRQPSAKTHQERRSTSANPNIIGTAATTPNSAAIRRGTEHAGRLDTASRPYPYDAACQDLLDKCSKHIDPLQKLQAIQDIKVLVLAQLVDQQQQARPPATSSHDRRQRRSAPSSRRSSFDPSKSMSAGKDDAPERDTDASAQASLSSSFTDGEIVAALRTLLLKLKPQTLFRDLQYISVFVQAETLQKSDAGKAFYYFGLAALAFKDEISRSMVDVADRIVAQDSIKRRSPVAAGPDPALRDAAQLLIIAAKEGNSIAQRELASLYLSHPNLLPVVTLPLSLPSTAFKMEIMWNEEMSVRSNTQTMCLALHWMQNAADNGDVIAATKLKEWKDQGSIR